MKLALIADTHFGARNDSAQFDAFFERFYTHTFFPYLDKHKIDTVVHLGDVFDRRKYINFQILSSCKGYFFDPLREKKIKMWVIPGNHDTYYKNTNEINSLDLLLREYKNIEVMQEPQYKKFGSRLFSFIPWVCGQNEEAVAQFILTDIEAKNDTTCFGHFEIDGFDMFRGVKNAGGMNPDVLGCFSSVLTGHFHHRSAQGNIFYLGSPYEFTWSDYNDARGFHIYDTETTELTFIENPNKIFHKIYYDDRADTLLPPSTYKKSCVKVIVTHKEDYQKFDKYIESLYNNDVIELTIHEDFSEFESETIGEDAINIEDTMTLLSEFVDSTETAKDKERLKTLLKTLYVEAQAAE